MAATPDVTIRLLQPDAEIETVTDLLHRAYARLAEMGLHYVATSQTPEVTLNRIRGGECYVACAGASLIGTVTFHDAARTAGAAWYDRPDVASLHQLGVEPAWQGRGIGKALVDLAALRATRTGAKELALDTAEPAGHLIDMYERWGFRRVGLTAWPAVNYTSVILSRTVAQV